MEHLQTIGQTTLRVVQGDITEQNVDAIVNAANSSLLGGGGVDGAIHRRGGPAILEACRRIVAAQGRCAPGQAVITTAGELPAKFVIHTVGPVWQGGTHSEYVVLERAYANSLAMAQDHGVRTLAFPAISTGAYGFPLDRATRVAINTIAQYVKAHADAFDDIRFVFFTDAQLKQAAAVFEDVIVTMLG